MKIYMDEMGNIYSTVKDLASGLGVSERSVYNFFSGKTKSVGGQIVSKKSNKRYKTGKGKAALIRQAEKEITKKNKKLSQKEFERKKRQYEKQQKKQVEKFAANIKSRLTSGKSQKNNTGTDLFLARVFAKMRTRGVLWYHDENGEIIDDIDGLIKRNNRNDNFYRAIYEEVGGDINNYRDITNLIFNK